MKSTTEIEEFLSAGLGAQRAVDAVIAQQSTPAGAQAHETAREIAGKLNSHFIGDQMRAAIESGTELIAALMAQRPRFATLHDTERRLVAEDLERLAKCHYALAAHLRGGTR